MKKSSPLMSAWWPIKGLFAAIVAITLVGCKKQNDLPKLVFDKESVEIGTIYKDSPYADFEIIYRNEGLQQLNVYRVGVDCPCTNIISVDSFIKPNGTGVIRGRIDMQEKPPGHFSEELIIFSDGTKDPVHYFLNGELKYK